MNKLDEYIIRYQGLHDGTDPFLMGNTQIKNNTVVAQGKIIFDGSQLGKKLPPFIQQVIDNKQRAITLLDYGCGKALHTFLPLKEHGSRTLIARFDGMIQCYYCYDPAVKQYSVKPPSGMVFDLVCCADVMEHIPEEFVEHVLTEVANYTKDDGVAMFTISGNPAKKSFKDGENLHATIKPVEWWLDLTLKVFGDKSFLLFYNNETKNDEPILFKYHNSSKYNFWNFTEYKPMVGAYKSEPEEV